MKPCMHGECELTCQIVSSEGNTWPLEQNVTSTKLDSDGSVSYVALKQKDIKAFGIANKFL